MTKTTRQIEEKTKQVTGSDLVDRVNAELQNAGNHKCRTERLKLIKSDILRDIANGLMVMAIAFPLLTLPAIAAEPVGSGAELSELSANTEKRKRNARQGMPCLNSGGGSGDRNGCSPPSRRHRG